MEPALVVILLCYIIIMFTFGMHHKVTSPYVFVCLFIHHNWIIVNMFLWFSSHCKYSQKSKDKIVMSSVGSGFVVYQTDSDQVNLWVKASAFSRIFWQNIKTMSTVMQLIDISSATFGGGLCIIRFHLCAVVKALKLMLHCSSLYTNGLSTQHVSLY